MNLKNKIYHNIIHYGTEICNYKREFKDISERKEEDAIIYLKEELEKIYQTKRRNEKCLIEI